MPLVHLHYLLDIYLASESQGAPSSADMLKQTRLRIASSLNALGRLPEAQKWKSLANSNETR